MNIFHTILENNNVCPTQVHYIKVTIDVYEVALFVFTNNQWIHFHKTR